MTGSNRRTKKFSHRGNLLFFVALTLLVCVVNTCLSNPISISDSQSEVVNPSSTTLTFTTTANTKSNDNSTSELSKPPWISPHLNSKESNSKPSKYQYEFDEEASPSFSSGDTDTTKTYKGIKVPLSRNWERQIGNSSGNPISLNLHEKVNGQGERGILIPSSSRRRVKVRVTDVNPQFGFRTGIRIQQRPILEEDTSRTYTKHVNSSRPSSSSPGENKSFEIKKTISDWENSPRGVIDTIIQTGDKNAKEKDHLYFQPFPFPSSSSSSSCNFFFPVIVNQTVENSKDPLLNSPDIDKLTLTLVKGSQCIANCLRNEMKKKNKMYKKKEMSHKKGINEVGGGIMMNKMRMKNKTTFIPVGIPALLTPPNNNGDITTSFTDKMLSTCQKSCEFPHSEKSFSNIKNKIKNTKNPISITPSRSSRDTTTEETNKSHHVPNQLLLPRDDKNSGDANKPFLLRWSDSSSLESDPAFTLYNVLMKDPLLPSWKLIDQTLLKETQISFPSLLPEKVCTTTPSIIGNKKNNKVEVEEEEILRGKPQVIIPLKVLAIGAKGLEKVYLAWVSYNKSTLASTSAGGERSCCQKTLGEEKEEGGGSTSINNTPPGPSSPPKGNGQRIQNYNKNSNNLVRRKNKGDLKVEVEATFTTTTTNKNSGIVFTSNKIKFKGEGESLQEKEMDPPTSTGGELRRVQEDQEEHDYYHDTITMPNEVGNTEERMNKWGFKNSYSQRLYRNKIPNFPKWGLHMVSMVYKNFLVVTEISWNFPIPQGYTRRNKNEGNSNKGGGRYQFLLTWEIFGGGLKGNLVTDGTSGSINLWPDTTYTVQVALLDMEMDQEKARDDKGSSPPSLSSSSVLLQDQHQNYMRNDLSGVEESIIFPLADFTNLQSKVTLTSELLVVNTSQLSSIPSTKSSSPGPPLSLSQTKSNNNPPKENLIKKKKKGNVRPITIPSTFVSTNGNEELEKGGGKPGSSLSSSLSPPAQLSSSSDKVKTVEEEEGSHIDLEPQGHLKDHHYNHPPPVKTEKVNPPQVPFPIPTSLRPKNNKDEMTIQKMMMTRDNPRRKGPSSKIDSYHHRHHTQYHYLYDGSLPSPLIPLRGSLQNKNKNSTPTADTNTYGQEAEEESGESTTTTFPSVGKSTTTTHKTQHHQSHPHSPPIAYRPEGYQGLFMNLGLGGYNYNYDEDPLEDLRKMNYSRTQQQLGPTSPGGGGGGTNIIYSVFILIVVACVLFLFIVAFVGFFILSSSISQTAQYFIPKRLKIWVIGGGGGGGEEGQFLTQEDEEEERDEETEGDFPYATMCTTTNTSSSYGRFVEDFFEEENIIDDVPDWMVPDPVEVDLTHSHNSDLGRM